MGASLLPGGATFRVWAPNAEQVTVTGEFNGWSDTASPLQPEGNGVWSGEIHGAAAGQQYKYAITYQGQKRLRNDPYTRELSASAGNSVIPDERRDGPDPGFTPPPWNELVIYVLHVGTFNPGPDGPPGDFPSVMARLDDLVRLGVNAIQLLPVAEFGTEWSWGYNPAQPFAVAQAYGGRSGFLDLVAAAHQRGLAVILDVVYSHFGPNNLDLWQFDGWSENKGGGIYFYNDFRAETPWGDTRPDYGRLEVQQYVRDNALMWLDECQVDGLRWDATAYIRNVQGSNDPANDLPDGWALMQSVNRAITALGPGKLSIAEDLPDQEMITRPAGEGGAGFAAQWDPDFGQSVRAVLTAVQDADRDLNPVIAAITHRYNQNAFQRVLYTESPNERPRLNEPLARKDPAGMPARPRAILGAALTLTAPGIPFLFQGQEFLESNAFSDQTPLDWSKATTHADVLGQYQELITLRRNLDGTTAGLLGQNVQVFHVNHKDKVLAFHRWDQGGPGDDVVVVVNLGGQAYRRYHLGLPRAGRWSVRFNSDPGADRAAQSFQQASEEGSDLTLTAVPKPEDELPYSGDVALGAYAVVILSQDVRREKATAA
jgi:1,4-alpha-glucan branching enzyme